MKKTLALALLISPLVACAQTDGKSFFGKLSESVGRTDSEVHALVMELATKGIEKDGLSPRQACRNAINDIIFTKYEPRRCEVEVSEIFDKKEEDKRLEKRRLQHSFEMAAEQEKVDRREQEELEHKKAMADAVFEIRAGKRASKTFEEAVAAYDAENGISLASAPKIRPDGKIYFLTGSIDSTDKKAPSFTALANNGAASVIQGLLMGSGAGESKYFYVRLQKSMEAKYYELAKIGIGFDFVGKYAYNMDYKTILGQTKSMPVFDAIYFEIWNQKKLR